MATLNITTNKTRAQMVTELTNWADATKVSGSDYVWACADDINVTATIDASRFTLVFAATKRMYASAGGTINVSKDVRGKYEDSLTMNLSGSISNLVYGTGKFVGYGLTINIEGAFLTIESTSSVCELYQFTINASPTSGGSFLQMKLAATAIVNFTRLSGLAYYIYNGIYSMAEGASGAVSGASGGKVRIACNNNQVFSGFVINADATNRFESGLAGWADGTATFLDSNIDPNLIDARPVNSASCIREVKRTISLLPKSGNDRSDISAFKYRISSNRVVQPSGAVTNDHTIVTNQNGDYNSKYVVTVFSGNTPTGTSAEFNPLSIKTIDKDMKVQYRKYRFKEATFSSNSYYFAVDAPAVMSIDRFVSTNPVIFNTYVNASQFYDSVRNGCANYLDIPEDIIITDGKTLTIKTGWTLKRSATATSSIIHVAPKEIVIDKDSYIGKMDTGIFKFDTIAGTVDATMAGHTNMNYTKTDGSANLQLSITCPDGSKDPVAGVWLFSQGLDNRAGMITGMASGTGIKNITLSVSATTKYYCTVKALGSNQYKPFIIEPVGGLGGSKEITLFVYEKNDGTPLLPDTLTPAQTAVAATLEFHTTHIDVKIPTDFATNPRWSSTDKIWQYKADDFIALAYKLDVIQTALILLGKNQLIFLQEGRILVSATANEKILEQDPDNKTTVSSTTNVKVSFTTISIGRVGDTDARNTFIDDVNGTIDVRGGVPINGGFSAGDASRLVAVKAETDKIPAIQTKADETHQRLALDSTKPLTSKPDGGITSTGIAITATELADGSVVQTRGT